MKEKTQIALAIIILIVTGLLSFSFDRNSIKEAKKIDSNDQILSTRIISCSDAYGSEQAKNTCIIINAFNGYTEKKLKQAILSTYDPSVLEQHTTNEIIKGMPHLIRLLKNTELEKTISETPARITLKLKKEGNSYLLDIYFQEKSQKIMKMGVAKLS